MSSWLTQLRWPKASPGRVKFGACMLQQRAKSLYVTILSVQAELVAKAPKCVIYLSSPWVWTTMYPAPTYILQFTSTSWLADVNNDRFVIKSCAPPNPCAFHLEPKFALQRCHARTGDVATDRYPGVQRQGFSLTNQMGGGF